MTPHTLTFKISSGLKDIIGRDLIPDDNIAVFEIVKNSYDAHATLVTIHFLNLNTKSPSIVIEDNGKGMNYTDLTKKWLWVAYSAKREGSEDDDYRTKIHTDKPFAGAKGIGRFSCDRLGKKLRLETIKDSRNAKKEILEIDWILFERSLRDEFIEIPVTHIQEENDKKQHGTKHIISKLRSEWTRERILTLKKSLSKLINPNQESKDFRILINCPDELENDSRFNEDYEKVNGIVSNFIFETLEIKTTKINVKISTNGEFVESELIDGGTLIYRIKELNPYPKALKAILFNVFYLNNSAKQTFKRRMGLRTKDYGSIFLYKNNIRIYPYGDPGDDTFYLDKRKAQKPSVYIGNKDLIGRIEVIGNNPEFKETSSRGDGFIRNDTYVNFLVFFEEFVIKRLERYVIDVQKWGGAYVSIEDETLNATDKDILHNRVIDLVNKLTASKAIINLEYNEEFLDVINERQSESAVALMSNLFRLANESGNKQILEVAEKTERRVLELRQALIEAEKESEAKSKELEAVHQEIEETQSENLFLRSVKSQDLDQVVSLMHHVGIYAGTVDNYLKGFYQKLGRGATIPNSELLEIIKIVSFEVKKIINVSKFATKANFKLSTEYKELNLGNYIKEYIFNILPAVTDKNFSISFSNEDKKEIVKRIKPIEINIIIDNLISNAKKAKANRIDFILKHTTGKKIEMVAIDNGIGINKDKLGKIFDFGYTTSNGSGLGLFHINEIVKSLNGKITVDSKVNIGTTFIIQLS